MRRISERTITKDSLKDLRVAIRDDAESAAARETLLLIIRQGKGTVRQYDRLYRHIVGATPDPDLLFDTLRWQIDETIAMAKRQPNATSRLYAWTGGSALVSAMRGYEATGQSRFLDLFVRAFDKFLKARDSESGRTDEVRGRVMNTWGTVLGETWTTLIAHVGRLGYPVGLFAKAVNGDPTPANAYGGKARKFVEAIEAALAEFDGEYRTVAGTGAGYYLR